MRITPLKARGFFVPTADSHASGTESALSGCWALFPPNVRPCNNLEGLCAREAAIAIDVSSIGSKKHGLLVVIDQVFLEGAAVNKRYGLQVIAGEPKNE